MTQNYPDFALFPELQSVLRTPSGITYRGSFRQHPSMKEEGEHWYEGYLKAEQKDQILADANLSNRFARDAARPDYFHPDSKAEPLHLKLNRIPREQRTDKNADTLIGEVWTHEGLWTVIATPSKSPKLYLVGSVVPSRHELEFEGSAIRQHQPQLHSEEDQTMPTPEAKQAAAKSRSRRRPSPAPV